MAAPDAASACACVRRLWMSPQADQFAGAAACFGMFAFALYTQYYLGLEPCPLCIFQRIGVVALGVVLPGRRRSITRGGRGRWVYAVLIGLAALATIGVAARHLYIQSLPPGSIPGLRRAAQCCCRCSPPGR